MAEPQVWYIFLLIPYFVPSFVAAAIGHRNGMAVFLLNLLLGWTVLGWAGALVWALRSPPNRRQDKRFKFPLHVPLHCIPVGAMSFKAEIVDLSSGGMAVMICDASVSLPPGTILKGCTFVAPGGEVMVADLEVRDSHPIVQPGVGPAQRSGLRFLTPPKGLDALLETL